jgi:2-iminobutanoate/2-iminopropanoate deaminase
MDSIKRVSWIDGITKPRASYSNFTKAGDFVFIAGQVGIDPDTGEIPIEFSKQMRIIFENIRKILESEGGSFSNIVKTTIFSTWFSIKIHCPIRAYASKIQNRN